MSGQVIAQLRIGTVVSLTSTKLGLSGTQATVTGLDIMSVDASFSCETADGALRGAGVERRAFPGVLFLCLRTYRYRYICRSHREARITVTPSAWAAHPS